MKTNKLCASFAALLLVTACQQPGGGPGTGVLSGGAVNKRDVGTVAGAVGGGVIGHNIGGGAGKTVATIAGTLLGAYIGSEIGNSLDNADRAAMDRSTARALEYNQPGDALPWEATNSGTVIPGKYEKRGGTYCREFTQVVNVGGRSEKAYGTACRQPDGSWKIVQ